MMGAGGSRATWRETVEAWLHPQVVLMLFFGFSAGIPIMLIFSTLSAWLTEAGVQRAAVTFFSWAALAYSFKFVWAPLVDRLPLPYLSLLFGRRRAWMLVAQVSIIGAIFLMATVDPAASDTCLTVMAWAAILLGFSSATQDIVIDAYRIECAEKYLQALLAASYIAGYRIGMLVAGAGSLVLAEYLGASAKAYSFDAWRLTYMAVGCCMVIGLLTTLVSSEPRRAVAEKVFIYSAVEYLRFFVLFCCAVVVFVTVFFFSGDVVSALAQELAEDFPGFSILTGFLVEAVRLLCSLICALAVARWLVALGLVGEKMLDETYIDPIKDFFQRYGLKMALLLLLLIGFYRVSDIVLGVISTIFYLDLGYSKTEIGVIVKTFGLMMTLVGGFVGGMLTVRYGVVKILFIGALLAAGTNVLFMLLATTGPDLQLLKLVVGADNLAAGLASAAFVAFLSSLTSISFTAMQYAVFSSLMSLTPKLIGGYSGTIVTAVGYPTFFLFTTLMGVPVLILIYLVRKIQ